MLKGYGVTLLNEYFTDEDINYRISNGETFESIYNVNYSYYITQANKIIEQLKPSQLSLWD